MIRDEQTRLLKIRTKNRPFIVYVGKDAIRSIKESVGGCVCSSKILDMQ